ncbi:GNAT family N-acetyltransferase [Mariniflexile sp. AS56]|uniref:GNAT family N-acetyltransferase n=1 Tax=Mariniflexile sp. AS56 TaxID=3063957 RepID=UPI0026EEDF44|nr:GNAT family N-acetyltransferase [Mariniflexile sp. AS56]MDO7172774.1 GNAT family N-acetyltransferase [Mariniflexile sp. AS56]
MINEEELDNPVWHALTNIHYNHAIDYNHVKFYQPDYTPFGAFINNADTRLAIEKHGALISGFFIVGDKPLLPAHFEEPKQHKGLQMIVYNKINHPITDTIVELTDAHYNDLIGLIKLVYPEYFRPKSNILGQYFGIYKDGKLVALTGERMQTNHFIEISAVITHPDYSGRGYAKQLVTHTANNIFTKNKTPFLHVDETNTGPVALYKKLGFNVRRKLIFWKITTP